MAGLGRQGEDGHRLRKAQAKVPRAEATCSSSWLGTRTGWGRQATTSGLPRYWLQPPGPALPLPPWTWLLSLGGSEGAIGWGRTPFPLTHSIQPSLKRTIQGGGQRHTPHRTTVVRARGEVIGKQFPETLMALPGLTSSPSFSSLSFSLSLCFSPSCASVSFLASHCLCLCVTRLSPLLLPPPSVT